VIDTPAPALPEKVFPENAVTVKPAPIARPSAALPDTVTAVIETSVATGSGCARELVPTRSAAESTSEVWPAAAPPL